jgi:predicted ATPase
MARIIREGKLQPQSGSITRITVGGFKSIVQEQSIEIKPLTILAGANSSGKSSVMQPLLLLKQTLEAPYDPGALLLNGANVKFTQIDQLLSRDQDGKLVASFHVGIQVNEEAITTYFERKDRGMDVKQTIYSAADEDVHLFAGMQMEKMNSYLNAELQKRMNQEGSSKGSVIYTLVRNRCFLTLSAELLSINVFDIPIPRSMTIDVARYILQVMHLQGLRGSPERNYVATAVDQAFPGQFEFYVASIIEKWQRDDDRLRLGKLYNDLARLALTNKVIARRRNDVEIELLVNRFLRGEKEDLVSIADVGIGVSQALPVVVAIHTANPGQLVYIEQPEIHLHPRAQYAMAEVLADAAKEGKQLVIETHSSILLLGIQTLVAEGKLPAQLVKLHWFTQQEDGSTKIDSADLDEAGAFGNWPEDFHTVTLQSENRYIDAAEARLMGE